MLRSGVLTGCLDWACEHVHISLPKRLKYNTRNGDHEVRYNVDMRHIVLLCAIFPNDLMTNVTKSGKVKSRKISFAHGKRKFYDMLILRLISIECLFSYGPLV